jgi:hypothetical protein
MRSLSPDEYQPRDIRGQTDEEHATEQKRESKY